MQSHKVPKPPLFLPVSQVLGMSCHWIQVMLTPVCKAQSCKCHLSGLSVMHHLFLGFNPLRSWVTFTWCLRVWNCKVFSYKTQLIVNQIKNILIFFLFFAHRYLGSGSRSSLCSFHLVEKQSLNTIFMFLFNYFHLL